MPRFAVNLSMLFTEFPLVKRFDAAAAAGFDLVEMQFPYELRIDQIRSALGRNQQTLVLINLPAGDWAAGERGIACHPDRIQEFDDGLEQALDYARSLDVKKVNCLSGIRPDGVSYEAALATFSRNLSKAAAVLEPHGIQLMAEPINTQDIPAFFLCTSGQLVDIRDEGRIDNLYLQYDVYHMQIMEGNLIRTLQNRLQDIGHIQVADVPGRHEPGTGEINFSNLFTAIDALGYSGVVGLEYTPASDTLSGLAQIRPMIGG